MPSEPKPSRISLGWWDPYQRVPSLEIGDSKIKFLPGKGERYQFQPVEADFPPGSCVEYRVQRGDMYFEGDHAQSLGRTLCVVEPTGKRTELARGFVLYMGLGVAARNLQRIGVPFRAVSFYVGEGGKEVERELPIPRSGARLAGGILLASCNLWLGFIAGLFIRTTAGVAVVGVVPLLVLVVATVSSGSRRRAALVKMLTYVPIYIASYVTVVVLTRFAFVR